MRPLLLVLHTMRLVVDVPETVDNLVLVVVRRGVLVIAGEAAAVLVANCKLFRAFLWVAFHV